MTQDEIHKFFAAYEELNRTEGTVQFYRRKLQRLFSIRSCRRTRPHPARLPEEVAGVAAPAWLYTGGWRMLFSRRQIRIWTISAIGNTSWQGQPKEEKIPQPELSRAEYLYLLRTARALGKEKVYLIISVGLKD